MPLTEYRRSQVAEAIATALRYANTVPQEMARCRQAVVDSRSRYLQAKQVCAAAGFTEQELNDELAADFAEDASAIFDAAGPPLIALLAEVSRVTGVSAQAALQTLTDAAPDTVPTDAQSVEINPATGAVYFNPAA